MALDLRGSVLDIGVGDGWLTRRVKPELYMGLEPSFPMMKTAAAACPSHAHRMLLCGVRDFYTPLKFDTVCVIGTASYLSEDDWSKSWSLVAPGGQLLAVWLRRPLYGCLGQFYDPRKALSQMELHENADGVTVGVAIRGSTSDEKLADLNPERPEKRELASLQAASVDMELITKLYDLRRPGQSVLSVLNEQLSRSLLQLQL